MRGAWPASCDPAASGLFHPDPPPWVGLEDLLVAVLRFLNLSTGWIVLLDEEGRFSPVAAHGLPPALAADGRALLRGPPCRCQRLLLEGALTSPVTIVDCERLERAAAMTGADAQTETLRVLAAAPLRAGDRVLGVMNVCLPRWEPPGQRTLALLGMVAEVVGPAVESTILRAREETARRREEDAVSGLAGTLLGQTDLEEIGAAAFQVLRERLEPDALSLLVTDPSGAFLQLVAAQGWSEAYVGRLQMPLHPPDANGAAWALHVGSPVVEDHSRADAPFATPDAVRHAGVQLCVNLPMRTRERAAGVLVADYLAPRPVREDQLRFAALVAGVTAVAVERAREHRRYRMLFERVPVGLYRSTLDGQLLEVNEALVRLLGYPGREKLLATPAAALYANPEDRARWQALMHREGVLADFEVQLRRYDGSAVWVRETARTVYDVEGRPAYYEGSAEDITARKRFESDVLYLANHDALTGAFNRRRFHEELVRQLARVERSGQTGALLFLDLDNFKQVNDCAGHKAGDNLLQAVARAIQGRLRDSDVFGRLGGDEFGVLLAPADGEQARVAAERILPAVREQVALCAGRPVRLTASCGIALFPEHGLTADEVLAAGDLAVYAAKHQGGDRVVVCMPDLARRQPLAEPLGWAERLRDALAHDRLTPYAQPILDLHRDRISGWELLVRLTEGTQVLEPAAFLPVAERLDLIQEIDLQMCRRALQLIARRNICVHVNLSAKTLGDDAAMHAILAELDASGVPPANLVLEITETAAVADLAQSLRCVESLRARGCRLALDDFGVGFSSLYYLRNLPVDYLKIDGTFTRTLAADAQNQEIVRAIAQLARGLGRATVAEWVKDEAALQLIRELGVDYGQGDHLGRPVPVSEL